MDTTNFVRKNKDSLHEGNVMSTISIVTKCDHIFYIKLKMSPICFSFLLSGRNSTPLSTNGLLSQIQFIIDLITKVRQYHDVSNTIYHSQQKRLQKKMFSVILNMDFNPEGLLGKNKARMSYKLQLIISICLK